MSDIYAAAVGGLRAQQARLDGIANNLANLNTTGYRAARVDVTALPQQPLAEALAGDGSQPQATIGEGVAVAGVTHSFFEGALQTTSSPLDLAIQGEDAFFQVSGPAGQPEFTRDGQFHVDGGGQIVNADGATLVPPIAVPTGTRITAVTAEGTVMGIVPGASTPSALGQLALARFTNPQGLEPVGDNRFAATAASGPAQTGTAGSAGFPALASQTLETSNVDLAEQAAAMIEAQRAYSLNVKAAQALDDMIGLAIQTRS